MADGRPRRSTMRVWRGDAERRRRSQDYGSPSEEGMVVLDVIHRIQATQAPDLAVRWNCKAGRCGSCSAEVNGKPRLMCMTRMNIFAAGRADHGRADEDLPADQGPGHRRLVQLREGARAIPAFKPQPKEADGTRRMYQEDVDRVQEFHKCIECFLCQNVCHVIRDHEENKASFAGPRFFVRLAALEMHPLDTNDRLELIKQQAGLGHLQHHQVLHRGLSRAHQDHRQRDHSAQGAHRDRVPRSTAIRN